MARLTGKNAIVTGSTRGIGRAIAARLIMEGANVCVTGTNEDNAKKVAVELAQGESKTMGAKLNIGDYAEMEKLIQTVKDTWGSVDIMVNNAGITKDNLILRMSPEDFSAVIDTNLKGVFNAMKACVPIMMRQRKGKIISIASVIGLIGNAGQANYSAAKAGVIALTKTIAKEYASRGIQVNAVAPGYIQTDMTDSLPDTVKEEVMKLIPMKRMGQPDDIAKAVVFLASDDSDYITGQTLVVDGGMVMA